MQYNDNIPAVFGFPLVIPHQRRGGPEEEGREEEYGGGRAHCSWQHQSVLSFSVSLFSSLYCSFLNLVMHVRTDVNYWAKDSAKLLSLL